MCKVNPTGGHADDLVLVYVFIYMWISLIFVFYVIK